MGYFDVLAAVINAYLTTLLSSRVTMSHVALFILNSLKLILKFRSLASLATCLASVSQSPVALSNSLGQRRHGAFASP